MSLGTNTKCDLNFDIAKIDITALNNQLRYRFFSIVQQIHNITGEIGYVFKLKDMERQIFETVCHKSKMLKSLAKQLSITAELAETIQSSGNRILKAVNLLPNPDEKTEN